MNVANYCTDNVTVVKNANKTLMKHLAILSVNALIRMNLETIFKRLDTVNLSTLKIANCPRTAFASLISIQNYLGPRKRL